MQKYDLKCQKRLIKKAYHKLMIEKSKLKLKDRKDYELIMPQIQKLQNFVNEIDQTLKKSDDSLYDDIGGFIENLEDCSEMKTLLTRQQDLATEAKSINEEVSAVQNELKEFCEIDFSTLNDKLDEIRIQKNSTILKLKEAKTRAKLNPINKELGQIRERIVEILNANKLQLKNKIDDKIKGHKIHQRLNDLNSIEVIKLEILVAVGSPFVLIESNKPKAVKQQFDLINKYINKHQNDGRCSVF